jgi:putative ABC transport system permease protein
MYSLKFLRKQPLRLIFTIFGIALCVILMLFLFSVYGGVADGSVKYIRENNADLWVLQRNATNILRGTSILSAGHGQVIGETEGVETVTPVLFVLVTVKKDGRESTVYLTGYEPGTGLGGPPEIVAGRNIESDHEIVLDRSFAVKFGYAIGDVVYINDEELIVTGYSGGTNAFVIQYAFITLRKAREVIGFSGIATCLIVKVKDDYDVLSVAGTLREKFPGVEVYTHDDFLQNNIREMEAGFLPLLYTVAAIGAIVLTVILSMLMSMNVIERRKDFAVMKTLGVPVLFLRRTIVEQALAIAFTGSILGLILFFPLISLIESISPEVGTKSSISQILSIVFIVWIIALISSWFSLRRLRKIYPLEAFS